MIWLAWHMWFLLLLAFGLGLLIGWWIWNRERAEFVDRIETTPVAAPMSIAPLADTALTSGKKPHLYESGPTDGAADDLKKIKGIGPKYELLLNEIGIYYYRQITSWTKDEIAWLDTKLEFPGRIEREQWQMQASTLRDGGTTDFSSRYDKGDTPSSY